MSRRVGNWMTDADRHPDQDAQAAPTGSNPYATGGGGVTLERRVSALYLARLLTAETAAELGPDRHIVSVAFQQAPRVAVDDLVILAARPDENEPGLRLALAVRRRPGLVRSDEDSQALVAQFVAALRTPDDGREQRLGLVVAGPQTAARQLAELADHARVQSDHRAFFELLRTPQRFARPLVARLEQLVGLVGHALTQPGAAAPDAEGVRRHTWELLRVLYVLQLRVEPPELEDWSQAQNRLVALARGTDLPGAGRLLDRLESLAGQYGPRAATVDATMLRRELHGLLASSALSRLPGWEVLERSERSARAATRDRVGAGNEAWRLERQDEARALLADAKAAPALIVSGGSGVGKSALALAAADLARGGEDPGQAVVLNLRQLPLSWIELDSALGAPLAEHLAQLSAPRRLLFIDGADAVLEGRADLLGYLVDEALSSAVVPVVVASDEARPLIVEMLTERLGGEAVAVFEVAGLSDTELGQLVATFPRLGRLVSTSRSRELLRRLVVVDLLVRSEVAGVPLSEAEAMREIWAGLVRRHERREHGLPDAREQVMLHLAEHALSGAPVGELEPAALDGLRRDGLLRSASDDPWQVLPQFAHDELRRYAVARVLLRSGDATGTLRRAGAPRWALSAAVLAAQYELARPVEPDWPASGRLLALQERFDALALAGHGERWADVPDEALLTLGDPSTLLADAWPTLRATDGLARLLRVLDQRHRTESSPLDAVVAEPVVALVLEEDTPWRDLQLAALLRHWLLSLVTADAPAGHPLRLQLRARLHAAVQAAQARQAAARAARGPEQAAGEDPPRPERSLAELLGGRSRRRPRPRLPREITHETVLEFWALLGPDLGQEGTGLLRVVAADSPDALAPALEKPGTGRALSEANPELLAELVEAYYLDDEELGFDADGIRRHEFYGFGPLSAWYRGPFWALLRRDLVGGVAVLNRLLNHAARARVQMMAGYREAFADEAQLDELQLTLIDEPRTYVGGSDVWRWYRATSVGPYPCSSALQALERVCDQALTAGLISPEQLVRLLLRDCENLAMPGLVAGLLVRHLERAGELLDPFLGEPLVWRLEFGRVTSEATVTAAPSEELVEPERRRWSLREAATWLVLNADDERREALRAVGARLIQRAQELAGPEGELVTLARAWASVLDRSTYRTYTAQGMTYVQSAPPEDVAAALAPGNADLGRGQEALSLQWRYFNLLARGTSEPPNQAQLEEDLDRAAQLLSDPPEGSAVAMADMAGAVAAYAVQRVVAEGATLGDTQRAFAVEVLMQIAERVSPSASAASDPSAFEMGADRLAARVLALLLLLLLPAAEPLQATVGQERVLAAGLRLAGAPSMEVRVSLARGLDELWKAACAATDCPHEHGLAWAIESFRDCVRGPRDELGVFSAQRLGDPVIRTLPAVPALDILVGRLPAGMLALGAAAAADSCVSGQARLLLRELLDAQLRGVLAHDERHRGSTTDGFAAGQALLALASVGDREPLERHIAALPERPLFLASLLRGLAVAADSSETAARTAREIWPQVIAWVLALPRPAEDSFGDGYFGVSVLAALAPAATPVAQPSREAQTPPPAPIVWCDPLIWQDALDDWLEAAAGHPRCVDAFLDLVAGLTPSQQATFGLPRIARLVAGDVSAVAQASGGLADWLIAIAQPAAEVGVGERWQRLVDELVVAGNQALVPYSQ